MLSLTVVRMAPVALALQGTGLSRTTVLFMGWFGPRGLALNRPGMSGDSTSWEGWSHVSEFVEEVSAGAA